MWTKALTEAVQSHYLVNNYPAPNHIDLFEVPKTRVHIRRLLDTYRSDSNMFFEFLRNSYFHQPKHPIEDQLV